MTYESFFSVTPLENQIDPHRQYSRFNSSVNLVNYVCKTATLTDYDPVCPFPFVNQEWGDIIGYRSTKFEHASDVVLGDCSQTFAESLGAWGFRIEQMFYMGLSVICAIGAFYLFLMLRRQRRKSESSMTLAEKLTLLNALSSVANSLAWIDFWCYSNIFPFWLMSFLKALTASTLMAIPASFITQAIKIVGSSGYETEVRLLVRQGYHHAASLHPFPTSGPCFVLCEALAISHRPLNSRGDFAQLPRVFHRFKRNIFHWCVRWHDQQYEGVD